MKKLFSVFCLILLSTPIFAFGGFKSTFKPNFKNDTAWYEKTAEKNEFSISTGISIWQGFVVPAVGLAFDTKNMIYKMDFGATYNMFATGSILYKPIRIRFFSLGFGITSGWYEYQYATTTHYSDWGRWTEWEYETSFLLGAEIMAKFNISQHFALYSDFVIPFITGHQFFYMNFGTTFRF